MSSRAVFAILLALIGGLRIAEVVVSKRRMRRANQPPVAEPWLFPIMAILHTGLVTLPLAEVLVLERPFYATGALIAGLVLAAATVLRVWTLMTLGTAWNVRVVAPDRIVTTGPYRYIRHPNYLVVILEIASIPMLHHAWMSALALSLLNAWVLWHRIRVEEATLNRSLAWRDAMSHKKRLIPYVF